MTRFIVDCIHDLFFFHLLEHLLPSLAVRHTYWLKVISGKQIISTMYIRLNKSLFMIFFYIHSLMAAIFEAIGIVYYSAKVELWNMSNNSGNT